MASLELTVSDVEAFECDVELPPIDRQPNLPQPQLKLLVTPDEPFGRKLLGARFGALAVEVGNTSIARRLADSVEHAPVPYRPNLSLGTSQRIWLASGRPRPPAS